MNNLEEMHKSPRWNQEEIENMNRPIISNEIESVIKKTPTTPPKQKSRTRWLHR